jgi:hypothetical protein
VFHSESARTYLCTHVHIQVHVHVHVYGGGQNDDVVESRDVGGGGPGRDGEVMIKLTRGTCCIT